MTNFAEIKSKMAEWRQFLIVFVFIISGAGTGVVVKTACLESRRSRARTSTFESCVWRAISSHHPQEVLLAQLSLYVYKGGLKPHTFHFSAFQ